MGLDTLVPHLRGRSSAVRSLLRVGATAAAPVLFGYLSDLYGLRSALLFTMPSILVAGFVTMFAIRTYVGDMHFAQAEAVRQYDLEESDPEDDLSSAIDEVLEAVEDVIDGSVDTPAETPPK